MTAYKKWNEHSGQVLNSVKGFDVIECEHCRFKHIVPIPTAEKLEMVYREDYYTKEKPLYIERSKEDEEWWNMVYAERYDKFEELLPSNRRKILDVGCGPGFFLAHGLNRGWETLGLEPSAKAAAHARSLGTKVKEEFLTEGLAKDLGQFDVVHMSKMLEHVPNPKEIILTARDLVSDSGLVYVDVPNDYNPFQQALVKACNYKPWWVAPPHHINCALSKTPSALFMPIPKF
jgi:2-polyprenyl-3-methyl-5-hydroxy-6-metoxy-1,4-benzoquinol methylase